MILLLLHCTPGPDSDPEPEDTWAGIALRSDGWLRGDLHVHTDVDGGEEDVATNIALARYLADPVFTAAHPEYLGHGLDYLALTDHRSVAQQSDGGYRSDDLILVGGEEFGSRGHAGLHGVSAFVDHDPDGDGTSLSDLLAAIDATHAQGATFSPNHPFLRDIPWPWDTTTHDGLEVWNSGWGLMSPRFREEDLAAWEERNGAASAAYRKAVQDPGSSSDQALSWYEAQLSLGRHLALIGGSDRHMVLLAGFPVTWVKTEQADEQGVVAGIRARRTFVSRTPVSAQVLLEADAASGSFGLGDQVPVDGAGEVIRLWIRVARAEGGLLRIRRGGAVADEEALLDAEVGEVLIEQAIDSDDFEVEVEVEVSPGDWLYPIVLEPLIAPGLGEDEEALVRSLATEAVRTGAEDFVGLAGLLAELSDPDVLFDPARCDPDDWQEDLLQCLPPDTYGFASLYVPDRYDRALNVVTEQGALTDRCMGAVGSALMFVEP